MVEMAKEAVGERKIGKSVSNNMRSNIMMSLLYLYVVISAVSLLLCNHQVRQYLGSSGHSQYILGRKMIKGREKRETM
jgi:hypothetical protein